MPAAALVGLVASAGPGRSRYSGLEMGGTAAAVEAPSQQMPRHSPPVRTESHACVARQGSGAHNTRCCYAAPVQPSQHQQHQQQIPKWKRRWREHQCEGRGPFIMVEEATRGAEPVIEETISRPMAPTPST